MNTIKSSEYWQRRESEALKHRITDEKEYDKRIKQIYTDMLDACQKEINSFYGKYADKEGISIAEAKKRVSQLDIKEYERKAKRYVRDASLDRKANGGKTNKKGYYFSPKAEEEMRLYNATMKINRLEMLKANIGLELIKGHDELNKFMGDILQGRTEDELKRQAGILGKTVKSNSQKAHSIANASFHNATFSDRIWMYQDMMKADLSKLLQSGLIQGKNPRALAKDLKKYFIGKDGTGGAAFNVERLMRTELARVQTEAQKQSFERNGFDEYEFIVNTGCCDICAGLDGKHFKVAKMMPGLNAPPMHPMCRCSTAAWSDDTEYEAWLNYLDKGGTTEEWNKLKAQSVKEKDLTNSVNDSIVKAGASVLPNRFKSYLPEKNRRLQIIEEGKNLDKPIFDSGLLGKLAKNIKPISGYYDVVMHGTEYGLQYFGENVDVETLCAIISQRKDYKKGTNIRLIICDSGAKDDGVARYIADKLHVQVLAPNKKAIVEKKPNGETVVYSGSEIGNHDGEFIIFSPQDEVK